MRINRWLVACALLVALMVLPPIPGYLISQLELATGNIHPAAGGGLWQLIGNPLRFVGTLLALAWVWAMANLRESVGGYLRFAGAFVVCGVLYVLPAWLGAFGGNLGWSELWWLLGTASWYEWMQVHAPLAGALCLGALPLLRPQAAAEPVGAWQWLLDRIGAGRATDR